MWIIIAVPAAILVIIAILYNTLIAKKNQIANVFGTTDAMLKKRYDLLPQLIAAVKAYMQHERAVLEQITKLRAEAASGRLTDDQKVVLDNQVTKALSSVMLAVENYPELKASHNFLHLQRTMNELEEQISAARRAYNAAVTDYNNSVEMFPTNILANMMNFKTKTLFEIPRQQRQNVDAGGLLNS